MVYTAPYGEPQRNVHQISWAKLLQEKMKSTAPSLSTHTDILPLRVMKACGDVFKDYIARRAFPL